MNDQGTNVIDLRERLDRGERIPVSELCRAREAELLPIHTAPVTRVPSPAEAEQAHLEQTLERHGLSPLSEVAERRERLLDEALLEQQHLLGQRAADALSLGRSTVASKVATAMRYVEEARREMGVGDV
jgi:DNA-binding NtrC family response regulator